MPLPRNQRRTDRTRARLLDAALAVFVDRGYDGASLGEITERADLGTGTLYLHFRDKRALYEAVVRRKLLAMGERWRERAAGVEDPAEQVVLMVRIAIEFFVENRRQAQLFLCEGPAVETFLLGDIGQIIAQLLVGRTAAPEVVANLVMGAALAAGRWWAQAPRAVDTEALIRTALDFCNAGISAATDSKKPSPRGARSAKRT